MSKDALDNALFEQLLSKINQETGVAEKKLEILFNSRGFLSANQAARILYAISIPSDKIRAIQILEPRLCRMTCSEARDIIGSFSIHNDKIKALECIKRVLSDCQTPEGMETILSAFPFEPDKYRALSVLQTVRSDVADAVPAGGHQGYAALGGLYTQCRPLVPHLYGPVESQMEQSSGYGKIQIPVEAKQGLHQSLYTSHPSYAFPPGKDYATDRGYPGGCEMAAGDVVYPTGAPPLGMHSSAPAPTGFQCN